LHERSKLLEHSAINGQLKKKFKEKSALAISWFATILKKKWAGQ
jgi:hypothetical protein